MRSPIWGITGMVSNLAGGVGDAMENRTVVIVTSMSAAGCWGGCS